MGPFSLLRWWRQRRRERAARPSPEPAPAPTPPATARPPVPRTVAAIGVVDDTWTLADKARLDPRLRVAVSLLERQAKEPMAQERAAVVPLAAGGAPSLPVHLQFAAPLNHDTSGSLATFGLVVPPTYLPATTGIHGDAEDTRHVTADLLVTTERPLSDASLRSRIQSILANPLVVRMSLSAPAHACDAGAFAETLLDMGLPADRQVNARTVDGHGVVIGVIDDGCCLAHDDFIDPTGASRIAYIWDQGNTAGASPWQQPSDFGYGRELTNVPYAIDPSADRPIDTALAQYTDNGRIAEDDVYAALDFPRLRVAPRPMLLSGHGTHVMDIAAGNGRALLSREGVAPQAIIIFVQLPEKLVASGGHRLTKYIEDGARYVFLRAKALQAKVAYRIPAVVNISFGGQTGPHDGTSDIEQALDALLALPDRAIVMAAGNSFAVDGHTDGVLRPGRESSFRWGIPGDDESLNVVDIWYRGDADVDLYLTPPGATVALGPFPPGPPPKNIVDGNGNILGFIDYVVSDAVNGDHHITVHVMGTAFPPAPLGNTIPKSAPTPPGYWTIGLRKPGKARRAVFHAWIERDLRRRGDPVHRRQTAFDDDVSRPRHTISGIATGKRTLTVGAYNASTDEVAEYSSCGPTRRNNLGDAPRPKPEVCAPGAADARGRGVRSAATRFAPPTRLNGTSAAAPHVAGLAALLLQLNRDLGLPPLTTKQLRAALLDGAADGMRRLVPNRHQHVDPHQPVKQGIGATWRWLRGRGAVNAYRSLLKIK